VKHRKEEDTVVTDGCLRTLPVSRERATAQPREARPTVSIVIPVLNEERDVEACVRAALAR